MKKIIVPVDFSPQAADALDFAIDFGKKVKSKILLLHILETPTSSFSVTGEVNQPSMETLYKEEFIKGVHHRLDEWAQKVREAGVEVGTRMKYGNPFHNISRAITEEKASLIIMGSKGASGLKEVFIGSNAERVIRYAACPVIVIKGPTALEKMRNLVLASDLSEEQDRIASKAKEVQSLLGLNMHVLKVRTGYNFLTSNEANKQLEGFARRNLLQNHTLNTIEAEYADEGIVEFAEEVNAGIILIGTHGKTGLAHFFGGSRAEDLVNESKIPVMTFKLPFD
ncbi:MAG: universal stress protein [Bacteroidota bacterium]